MTHDDSSRVLISVARWCKAGIVLESSQLRERENRSVLAPILSAVLYLSQFMSVLFSTMYVFVEIKGTII